MKIKQILFGDCQNYIYSYPLQGMLSLVILMSSMTLRVSNIISKIHKYRFPSNINFPKYHKEIAASVIVDVNEKMLNLMPQRNGRFFFLIVDTHISFFSRNTNIIRPKPKSFCHLKLGIQDSHMKYVLVPADKATNKVVAY